MEKKRKSAKFKSEIVMSLLRGETAEELSRKHSITISEISGWRDEFVTNDVKIKLKIARFIAANTKIKIMNATTNDETIGSKVDLQMAVANPTALNEQIISLNKTEWQGASIKWYSPLKETYYEEFKDDTFYDGKFPKGGESFWNEFSKETENCDKESFKEKLKTFWPKGGPSWDGIAVMTKNNGTKSLLIIEAKAHSGEFRSSCGAIKEKRKIVQILNDTKKILKITKVADWTKEYYQFANRLAWCNFLRETLKIDAYVVNILFAFDPYWDNKGNTIEDLKEAYKQEKAYFGFDDNSLSNHGIYELTIDLRDKGFAHINESTKADLSHQKIIDLMEKTCK